MRILLINHYAGSTEYGMEYRPYYLSREWVRMGHEVKIVAASYSHLRIKQPDLKGQTVLEEEIDGISYRWLKTPSYKGNGLARIRNMLCFLRRLWFQSKELAEGYKPDMVICSSTYPLDIYPGRRIARMSGAKLVFELHDLWPLTPKELGNMPSWHPFIMVMQAAENYVYRHVDAVVSMLPKAEPHMWEHGLEKGKFTWIPNGVDLDEWEKSDAPLPDFHESKINELKAKGNFLVGYVGTIGLSNALEYFVKAGPLLEGYPVSLVLVGKGPKKEELEQLKESVGAENVHFLPPVQKNCIPVLLSRMDALFLGWEKRNFYRYGISPNKLMDYMMAGKPIVHSVDAGNDPVAENGCGISVAPQDPSKVAEAIRKMLESPSEILSTMGQKGKASVRGFYSYYRLARLWPFVQDGKVG